MIGLKPVVLGLVLLICSNTCHCDGRETSAAPTVLRNTKNLLRRIAELVEGVEDHREDGHREDHREDGHREDGHRENHREEDHREDHREEDHREDHREDGPWEDHREDGHGEDGHRQDHREDHRENGHGEDGDREKRRSPINLKTDPRDPIIEIFPRDLRKKEKFIKHLTGPLYFSPKCRKHVYRLYHNTRGCTIPAYFKRCARLLTRLAESPRCTQG